MGSNLLIYSCAFFPALVLIRGISLQGVTVIVEALTVLLGMRLFNWLQNSWVELLYKPINASPPSWIRSLFRLEERLCDFAVFVCYALHFASHSKVNFLFVFYLVLSLRMVTEPIVIIYIVSRTLRILQSVQMNSANLNQLTRAQMRMRWVVYLGVVIIGTGIATILLLLDVMLHLLEFAYDEVLWLTVMHSVFYTLLVAALLLWIYKHHSCCVVDEGSVWSEYCLSCHQNVEDNDDDDGDALCVGLVKDDTTSRLTLNPNSHASTVSVVPSHSINASAIHNI